MDHFLKLVAEDLFEKNGCKDRNDGLANTTIVFPNRRAKLFFDEWLLQKSQKPLWSPSYTTIQELFLKLSGWRRADLLNMVSMLHGIYCDVLNTQESLDSFWSWGELMIRDFDDMDRNMVDCRQLFMALSELKEMSEITYLDDNQKQVLQKFFKGVNTDNDSNLRDKYRIIWNALGTIYDRFTTTLAQTRHGYDGLIQRKAIESINENFELLDSDQFVFVGFNSLDKAEKALFRKLRDENRAKFYWDYDNWYTSSASHEAGTFMRDNLNEFPNELSGEDLFSNITKEKKMSIVDTSTDNAQARFIPEWIESLGEETVKEDTAIVLCDESLLQPVLHSIPKEKVDAVNITMGYPLSQTSVYSLVQALIELQKFSFRNKGRFTLELAARVLCNPLITTLSEGSSETLTELRRERKFFITQSDIENAVIAPLFRNLPASEQEFNRELLAYLKDAVRMIVPIFENEVEDTLFRPMNQEAAYKIFTQLNRLHSLTIENKLEVSMETMCRLIQSVLHSITVPFHGEPVLGLQIMGLLETRNLDFKNVLLLSAGEGSLPNSGTSVSFIPYSIRIAFGMTTMKEKSAVASYNFYHLLQRAQNVTMVYNSNSDVVGVSKGQISRYLLQLMTEKQFKIERTSLTSERGEWNSKSIEVDREDYVTDILLNKYDSRLDNDKPIEKRHFMSPTAINQYIDCPLKFYLCHVAGLNKPDNNDIDIDTAMFGTLFHKSAELSYEMLASQNPDRIITKEALEKLIKDSKMLDKIVCQAFTEDYFRNTAVELKDYIGTQAINHNVIKLYLKQILTLDCKEYAPFHYIGGELNKYETFINVDNPNNPGDTVPIRLAGIIDRLDSRIDTATGKETVRIVDYKTGGKPKKYPDNIDSLFDRNLPDRFYQALQIFYYAFILSRQSDFKNKGIAPVLLYTRSSSKPNKEDLYYKFAGELLTDFNRQCLKEYEEKLTAVVKEIFDPSVPFTQTSNHHICANCDFAKICNRQ